MSIAGLVTFLGTVLALAVVEKITSMNLFSFKFWVIVPVGAILTGFAAASGYYLASVWLHVRPTLLLLVQMIVVAAFAQIAIYYAEYAMLVLDDGTRIAAAMPFLSYLDFILTHQHMRVGRAMVDTGEMGSFGYLMYAVEFVGFIVGGVAVYGHLSQAAACPHCDVYYRTIGKRDQHFKDQEQFAAYYDGLFSHPVDGPVFPRWLAYGSSKKDSKGSAVSVHSRLRLCPSCMSQIINQKVQVLAGNDWREVADLERTVEMPDGVNVGPAFRAESA